MPALTPTTQDTFYGPSIHQSYDVYRHPVRDVGGNPVLVYRHGGGWASNDKRDIGVDGNASNRLADYLLKRTLPTDTHFDIISVESRQFSFSSSGAAFGYAQPNDAPAFFPEAWDDLKLALVHIKQNATTLGIDPKKMVLFGNSAGATTMWWSQLTAPLVVDGVDSRALAMIFEKPLVDFRRDGAGTETYSSATDNFYDYVFGTVAGVGAYPGTQLSTATRNAASIAWYYETNQLQYAIPTLIMAGPQRTFTAGGTIAGPATSANLTGFFAGWVNNFDRLEIVGSPKEFTGAPNMSPAALYKGYMQVAPTNGIYNVTSGGLANGRVISPACGAPAITATTSTVSRDGMQITNAAFSSYVHQDGDMLWIHAESAAGTAVLSQSGAGAYRVMGKSATIANTIEIDRSCRTSSTIVGTVDATLYPRNFSVGATASFSKIPGKPYVDPHDPQQYASMQSLNAQNQDTSLLSFLPYFQYDGDAAAPFVDYRHSAMLYAFAAGAVKGRPTALSSTLVGSQVG
jgi:hypothetical protein